MTILLTILPPLDAEACNSRIGRRDVRYTATRRLEESSDDERKVHVV